MSTSLTESEIKKLVSSEIANLKKSGIQFAIAGNSGYGKTSTINILFNTDMKTDAIDTATTEVHAVSALVKSIDGTVRSNNINDITLTVYDLPGLGDGKKKNQSSEDYFQIYTQVLPQMDVILRVLRADVKTFELDIQYISRLLIHEPRIRSRVIIGLNYFDNIEPQNWDNKTNNPSKEQWENVQGKINVIKEIIHEQCGLTSHITVPYSAKRAWGLENLFLHLIRATPPEKQWVIADLKLDYRESFLKRVPAKFRDEVEKLYYQDK